MIDTGTGRSLIDDGIAAALALDRVHSVVVQTALGSTTAPCYAVEFSFVASDGVRHASLPLVVAHVENLREQMLIGRDVLNRLRFEWDGPSAMFRFWLTGGLTGN